MPPKKKKPISNEDLLEAMGNGFQSMEDRMATKDDLKAFASKRDFAEFRLEINESLKSVATKDDLRDLENKLIEDTGAVTGVEQKHYRSHAQRIARLEKEVFPKTL